ncbi:MAG: helix-turn-helix transcriptional regulator [Ktedonobacteraceae bacterium]|nr:helix-turn-helix transcriptional regulator [Ktedonobacteraceae bacterium]
MPRPSKHISPDTLGGHIRAARESLQLSLAEVADGHYSTSLLSQIERNRLDPSPESLRFLAERLKLPLEDLESLARQHRSAETEENQHKSYEELHIEVLQYLKNKEYHHALSILKELQFSQIPIPQRWRLAALRGHAYFEQRKFLEAQRDFMYAINERPRGVNLPDEQQQELMLLHLHLAGTHRELQQSEPAQEQYELALQLVNSKTPFGHVAEAHWGLALIGCTKANKVNNDPNYATKCRESILRRSLGHAENARFLYRSMGDQLKAAAVTCEIAHIEKTLGEVDQARTHLEEVLSTWSSSHNTSQNSTSSDKPRQQDEANVISAAACSLAALELEGRNYDAALRYGELALEAGKRSYKIRRADAYLMRGRILEAINPRDPEAEESFRRATAELASTHRIAARIGAHVRLGHHLLKIGKIAESEQELELARHLSELVSAGVSAVSLEDIASS